MTRAGLRYAFGCAGVGDPAPGRAVMFTAWMKWDQRLWREHDRRRERMLRHAQ